MTTEPNLGIPDDGRIRIFVNADAKMSRGKYAAAAVHAALTAMGVHPGVPVIVLGGKRGQVESMRTVIRDAGHTEVEPGTATAGTDYTPNEGEPMDQREALRRTVEMAEERKMPELPGSTVGLAHLRSMLARVEGSDMSPSKLGRWLGWAQCAVVVSGVADLDEMKALNFRLSGDDPSSSRP